MYAVGKKGMKILSKKELQDILAKRKLQKGGVIGTDTNLLPEGALHARLHHLDEVNKDLEEATKKGIPVLDANGQQVAEIEKEELILRLELTKKIEELMKDGSEEAMIEAGKLLVSEILENTQDNTGQLTEEV
jgi:phosphosulfolactate synthase (CoM biosynthesis protein A)